MNRLFSRQGAARRGAAAGVLALGALIAPPVILLAADGAGPPPASGVESFHAPDPYIARLIARLLDDAPAAEALRARRRSLQASVRVESALPDPEVAYRRFVDSPETRVGPQLQSLEVKQRLPWGGKRGLQGARLRTASEALSWQAVAVERSQAAELKRLYFHVAHLQEELRINEEEAELLRRFEEISLKRYSTGEGNQQSVIKVQTDLSRLEDAALALRTSLDVAEGDMARLLGSEGHLPLPPATLPALVHGPPLDVHGLAVAELDAHPAVRAARSRVEGSDMLARRRELDRRPDFHVGLSYIDVDERQDVAGRLAPPEGNGQDIWSFSVGLNLPVQRRRIRAGIDAANEESASRALELAQMRQTLAARIRGSARRLESSAGRFRLYGDVLLPQAAESLASAEAAYTTGRLGFLDLLDAERVLFALRRTELALRRDFWIAATDLEEALGRRFIPGGES